LTEFAFIGDIHGCLTELKEVVEYALSRTRHLVFLGDYVNRGHHSREVIDYLIRLNHSEDVVCTFLLGNHDEVFLDALSAGNIDTLLRMGGATTIASYVYKPTGDILSQFRQSVPEAHIQFFSDLVPWMTTDDVFAIHAPDLTLERERTAGQYRIYGHLPQQHGKPKITATHAFIDTGCGTTEAGRLTCLFWPELDWFQSSQR
jgi:calcineurin-like phosphoesterase family protein